MITTAEVVMGGQETSAETIKRLQDFINEAADERMIKTSQGSAEVYVKKDSVSVTAKGTNGMVVNEYGTTLDGAIHFAPDPNNIRIGGFWTLNNELLTTLPSTIYTPIPVLVYDEPGAVKTVQSLVKFLGSI